MVVLTVVVTTTPVIAAVVMVVILTVVVMMVVAEPVIGAFAGVDGSGRGAERQRADACQEADLADCAFDHRRPFGSWFPRGWLKRGPVLNATLVLRPAVLGPMSR